MYTVDSAERIGVWTRSLGWGYVQHDKQVVFKKEKKTKVKCKIPFKERNTMCVDFLHILET